MNILNTLNILQKDICRPQLSREEHKMRYSNIHATSFMGHCCLQLLIDGIEAEIYGEQKPTLINNGFLYVNPHEIWSERLPTMILNIEGGNTLKLESFLKTEALLPVIFDMYGACDLDAFNTKWAGIVIDEDTNTQVRFVIKDE